MKNEIQVYRGGLLPYKKAFALNPEFVKKLKPIDKAIIKAENKKTIELLQEENEKELIRNFNTVLTGVSSMFSTPELKQIDFISFYKFALDYYKEFTLTEIKQAFEFLIIGNLNQFFKNENDKKPFNRFSIEFFTRVLNAYKLLKLETWKKTQQIKEEKEKIDVSEDEKKEIVKSYLVDKFELYKKNNDLNFKAPGVILRMLFNKGFTGVEPNTKPTDFFYKNKLDLFYKEEIKKVFDEIIEEGKNINDII